MGVIQHPALTEVRYPGLSDSASHQIAVRQFSTGSGDIAGATWGEEYAPCEYCGKVFHLKGLGPHMAKFCRQRPDQKPAEPAGGDALRAAYRHVKRAQAAFFADAAAHCAAVPPAAGPPEPQPDHQRADEDHHGGQGDEAHGDPADHQEDEVDELGEGYDFAL